MAALYDLFRTPQPKDETKVRYHARSVVTGVLIAWEEALCNATALRRLKARVKEGKLSHPGHLRAPFYFPVPGNYGVSRD